MYDLPETIRTLRGYLPAEMRVLRGVLGVLGGAFVFGGVLVSVLGGNWHLGYVDSPVLAAIYLTLVPAAVGVGSPVWYWIGRPAYLRFGRPGAGLPGPLRGVRFLPGLAGTVLGVALVIPVTATSGFWVQTTVPLGLIVGIGSPAWFWFLRPVATRVSGEWLPGDPNERSSATIGRRPLVAVAALLAASVAITAVLALPVVAVGEPVTDGGLAVTITDVRTVTELTEVDGGRVRGEGARGLLVVRIAVENRGDASRALPGGSVGDVAVIAPECRVGNFGEPRNNCNRVYLDGNFSAGGTTYANYEDRHEAAGGTVEPGRTVAGWLVFRIETRPDPRTGGDAMVVVDGVGRWALDGGWRDEVTAS